MTREEKYFWLIDTIHRAKRITLREISNRWMDYADLSGDPEDHYKSFRPKFYRWKEAIYNQLNIEIDCEWREGTSYFYIVNPEVIEETTINKWLMNSYETYQAIQNGTELHKRILVNDIPSANVYLKSIISAMKNDRKVEISYHKYGMNVYSAIVEPYCVKLFENRWYMLGREGEGNNLKNFSIDRISDVKILEETFVLPDDFDAESYFENYYGIYVDEEMKPHRVVIRAYSPHHHYAKSLPLHHSQNLIEDNDEYADFEMFLVPTYDFVMKLLSFGSLIEVMKPASLRDTMRGWVYELRDIYKD